MVFPKRNKTFKPIIEIKSAGDHEKFQVRVKKGLEKRKESKMCQGRNRKF